MEIKLINIRSIFVFVVLCNAVLIAQTIDSNQVKMLDLNMENNNFKIIKKYFENITKSKVKYSFEGEKQYQSTKNNYLKTIKNIESIKNISQENLKALTVSYNRIISSINKKDMSRKTLLHIISFNNLFKSKQYKAALKEYFMVKFYQVKNVMGIVTDTYNKYKHAKQLYREEKYNHSYNILSAIKGRNKNIHSLDSLDKEIKLTIRRLKDKIREKNIEKNYIKKLNTKTYTYDLSIGLVWLNSSDIFDISLEKIIIYHKIGGEDTSFEKLHKSNSIKTWGGNIGIGFFLSSSIQLSFYGSYFKFIRRLEQYDGFAFDEEKNMKYFSSNINISYYLFHLRTIRYYISVGGGYSTLYRESYPVFENGIKANVVKKIDMTFYHVITKVGTQYRLLNNSRFSTKFEVFTKYIFDNNEIITPFSYGISLGLVFSL
jgi:hypothetical protein